MKPSEAEARFNADVGEHVVRVLRDDGFYRHITCRRPQRSSYWFEIVTWPGVLTIHGDMGTFTFRRLTDMFEFFRGRRINPSYWGEKLVGGAGGSPRRELAMEFRSELWAEAVRSYRRDDDDEWNAALEELIAEHADASEQEMYQAAHDFGHEGGGLDDFFEHTLRDYTLHYLWCCHAITWAIAAYDRLKSEAGADQPSEVARGELA